MGEQVRFPSNGRTCAGWLETPPGGGTGPGILLVQEWWGLVPHIVDVAGRLAREGYVVVAPDLYDGRTIGLDEPDEAAKAMMRLDLGRAARDMSGAVDLLLAHPAVEPRRVGSVGFCMGGTLALLVATIRPVDAVVDYYGGPLDLEPAMGDLRAAVLGHFAELDDWATVERARTIFGQLRDLGREAELHVYPGTQHAFFNDTRAEVHDPEAAALSWGRTLAFLHTHLAGGDGAAARAE